MRSTIRTMLAALAVAGAVAGPQAFAQNGPIIGKPANDGGMPAQPAGAPQYTGSGGLTAAPGNETSNCAARFHSFDPATGTYLGRDGQRHPCP